MKRFLRNALTIACLVVCALILIGCNAARPTLDRDDPVPAVARSSEAVAGVASQLDVMRDLGCAAQAYVGQTGDYIQAAVASLSTGAADGVATAMTQLGKAAGTNEQAQATLASQQRANVAAQAQVTKLAGMLVDANGQIRTFQHERAAERMKLSDDVDRATKRADAAESSRGYRVEKTILAWWFWLKVVGWSALAITIVAAIGSRFIGGVPGIVLSAVWAFIKHIGTAGLSTAATLSRERALLNSYIDRGSAVRATA